MSHKRFHGVDRVTQTSYFTTFVWMARVGRAKLTRLTAARLGRIRRTACDCLIYYGGPNVPWTRSTPTAMMGFSDGGKRGTGQNRRVGVVGVGLTKLSRNRDRSLCVLRVTTTLPPDIYVTFIFFYFRLCLFLSVHDFSVALKVLGYILLHRVRKLQLRKFRFKTRTP